MPAFLGPHLPYFPSQWLYCEEVMELGFILPIDIICIQIYYELIIPYLNLCVSYSQQYVVFR